MLVKWATDLVDNLVDKWDKFIPFYECILLCTFYTIVRDIFIYRGLYIADRWSMQYSWYGCFSILIPGFMTY